MNVSMGQLVNDAKELVMRLKEREKSVDQVVVQSNALAKKVDAIQQLETELITINEKANHRSKVAVLSSIQKENKVIKLLQQENEDLKESLEEHQSVLEIIMSKYRQQMLQLIKLKKQQELSEDYFQSAVFKSLQQKTDQIAEMTEIMKHAVNVDEQAVNEKEELLQSLIVENQGLKEMLKIRSKYGAYESNSIISNNNNNTVNAQLTKLVDKECQTEEFSSESVSEKKQQEDKLEISKLMNLLVLNTEMGKQETLPIELKEESREKNDLVTNKLDGIPQTENHRINEITVLQSIENLGEEKSKNIENQKVIQVPESTSFYPPANEVNSLQLIPVVVNLDIPDSVKENPSSENSSPQEIYCQEVKSKPSSNTVNSDTEYGKTDSEKEKPMSETSQGIIYKTEMVIKSVLETVSPDKSTTSADQEERHETVN